MRLILAAAVSAVAPLFMAQVAGAAIVDTFDTVTAAYPVVVATGSMSVSVTDGPTLADVLGGTRAVKLESTAGLFAGAIRPAVAVYNDGTDGLLEVASPSKFKGKLTLTYGGPGGSSVNVDGTSTLNISILSYDSPADAPLMLDVFAGSGIFATSLAVPIAIEAGGPQTIAVDLTEFGFSTIDQLSLVFTAPAGADYQISAVTTTLVPEPTVMGLAAMPALAMLRRRRA